MKYIATDTSEFKNLIGGGYVYVDKTALLHRLVSGVDGTQFFISRPRRFGKSLMLSTLRHIFEGHRDLFRDLAIDKLDYGWKVYPVINLDMSDYDMEPGAKAFDTALRHDLLDRLAAAKIPCRKTSTASELFAKLIQGVAAKSPEGQVVLLVDEYDHPLGGLLNERRQLLAMRRQLQGFYRTLKNNAGHIRFLMMTGVSKFSKMSVFSGLNNLCDLSMSPNYSSLFGYTHEEMRKYLQENVAAFAKHNGWTRARAFKALLAWYDSYRFSPSSDVRVVNPVAVGRALATGDLMAYWSMTGMPTLVLERLQACGKLPADLDGETAYPEDLDVCDAETLPYQSLLYQSGYLTIKDVVPETPVGSPAPRLKLVLGIPNLEVRESLRSAWWRTLLQIDENDFTSLANRAGRQLAAGDIDDLVCETLFSLYAKLPPTWTPKCEADAKRYFLLFMEMAGAKVRPEQPTLRGYADAIVETSRAVYVFEFKYNRSAATAIRQIREKGYAEAYRADNRPVMLVGINFSSRTRNIEHPKIERLGVTKSLRVRIYKKKDSLTKQTSKRRKTK